MRDKRALLAAAAIGFIILGGILWRKKSEPLETVYRPNLQAEDFVPKVDNPFFTLTPGAAFVYEGVTSEGKERIEVEVTDQTKTILGIQATVVRDRVYLDGALIEDTWDWYAQDKVGNVWYLGEDTKEYEGGAVVSTKGSWEAGVDGAQPGVVMWADPAVGREYRQEYYASEAEDMAEVIAVNESVQTVAGSYDGCLKTRDWTPLEEKIDEYKWYCPTVGGLVLEVGVYSKERLELISAP